MAKVTSGTTVLEVDAAELALLVSGLECLRQYRTTAEEDTAALELLADLKSGA